MKGSSRSTGPDPHSLNSSVPLRTSRGMLGLRDMVLVRSTNVAACFIGKRINVSWIEQLGYALLTVLGLGLAAVIGLLLYRLLSLVASSRRNASRQRATEVAEDKLFAHLRADGFSSEDAEAALRATETAPEKKHPKTGHPTTFSTDDHS